MIVKCEFCGKGNKIDVDNINADSSTCVYCGGLIDIQKRLDYLSDKEYERKKDLAVSKIEAVSNPAIKTVRNIILIVLGAIAAFWIIAMGVMLISDWDVIVNGAPSKLEKQWADEIGYYYYDGDFYYNATGYQWYRYDEDDNDWVALEKYDTPSWFLHSQYDEEKNYKSSKEEFLKEYKDGLTFSRYENKQLRQEPVLPSDKIEKEDR